MAKRPFMDVDPARAGYQYLEDLATAYWYSEVLFVSLELKLFDHLQNGAAGLESLACNSGCRTDALLRLLRVLCKLELIGEFDGKWHNNPAASKYLVSANPAYLGDFLLYRQYLRPGWERLLSRLTDKNDEVIESRSSDEDYAQRNLRYVRAMDALAREKSLEIITVIPERSWQPPVLDIGGGAGSLCRAFIRSKCMGQAYLLELPEVLEAARKIYPKEEKWENIHTIAGDFRTYRFRSDQKFGLILMGNFLHTYGPNEARKLFEKARLLLAPQGFMVVHDYFPDRGRSSPHKGAFYDLNMMLNTYDGICHESRTVCSWMQSAGLTNIWRRDLSTDSAVIIAAGPGTHLPLPPDDWPQTALTMGFRNAAELPAEMVTAAPWVRQLCRHGCAFFGKKLQCPPHCITVAETQTLLKSYTRVLLVESTPPGRQFHEKLLALERKAFLRGHHKAFVFGAGPCPLCDQCPEDGVCRKPGKARPSMEGAGIDVYGTVRKAGLSIEPVRKKGDYVKYFGLLLLE